MLHTDQLGPGSKGSSDVVVCSVRVYHVLSHPLKKPFVSILPLYLLTCFMWMDTFMDCLFWAVLYDPQLRSDVEQRLLIWSLRRHRPVRGINLIPSH